MPKAPQALVGGQAVIEGVMMRSPKGVATAVRRPDGSIAVRFRDHQPVTRRARVLGLPIVRGAVTLVEALVVGTSELMWSAEESAREESAAPHAPTSPLAKVAFGATTVVAFVAGLALFFWLPLVLTDLLGIQSGLWFNLVDGGIRLVIFFLYLYLVTRWREMRRVFEYHGAEHMTIFNYEAEVPISVANSRGRPRLHPRCGTSFLFFVMLVSILVFAMLGRPHTIEQRLLRIAFVPVIGGLSYEVIRLSARIESTWLGKLLAAPGKALQLMTTAPPDDTQLEVAVAALKAALTGDVRAHEPDPVLATSAAAALRGQTAAEARS
ncbi:MAG: DUF1385 domain-containing protein [bacterium]